MSVYPGRRKHRIQVLRHNATTQNSRGEDVLGSPYVVGNFYAAIDSLQGREGFNAQQVWPEARLKLSLAFWDGILPKDLVTWGTKNLEILDVQHDNDRRETVLICKRQAG